MDPKHLPACSQDGNIHVYVEIPKGSRSKYEYDEDLGVIKLDRSLYSAVHYPTDYGFVPSTRSQDDELLDAMVLIDESTFPGCVIETRLIGVLTIRHGSGTQEYKLLTVPVNEPRFDEYHDIADIPHHVLKEIEHFFDVFKELEGKDLTVDGWDGADRAREALQQAMDAATVKEPV
ncbi:MAG: inorganic diphosphatase [Chloroflexota bacterium]